MSYHDETSRTLSYASHDCLEGLLQRGRGLGAIRAHQDPDEAREGSGCSGSLGPSGRASATVCPSAGHRPRG